MTTTQVNGTLPQDGQNERVQVVDEDKNFTYALVYVGSVGVG